MTDKERLETIKELVKKIESILYDEWRQQELTSLIESLYYDDHVDWLINRVEELELEVNDWREKVQKWQKFYKESEESHLETKELLKSIVNQNKRYREALKNIYELAEYDEYDNTLEQIVSEIEKALEV